MPFPIVDKETVLDSFSTSNSGSRPLGHNTIYHGASLDDISSIFSYSTNSTASNLPGPGRVLGNFYSSTGKRLERTLGDLAHKAGFGPEAIYQQISTLYREDWKTDVKIGETILVAYTDLPLTMNALAVSFSATETLLQTVQTDQVGPPSMQASCSSIVLNNHRSIVDSTRFRAIMRWGDILRDHHELYVWLFCSQQTQTIDLANDLLRIIKEFRSTSDSLSRYEDDVLTRTTLLIDCHSVGLNAINLNRARLLIEGGKFRVDWTGVTDIHREEIEKWDLYFQHLLEFLSYVITDLHVCADVNLTTRCMLPQTLRDPTISELSRWYIDFWSSQIVEGNMHFQIALHSCRTLQCVLKAVNPSQVDRLDALQSLCKAVYTHHVRRFDSDTLLLDEGAYISSTLNDLTQLHDVSEDCYKTVCEDV